MATAYFGKTSFPLTLYQEGGWRTQSFEPFVNYNVEVDANNRRYRIKGDFGIRASYKGMTQLTLYDVTAQIGSTVVNRGEYAVRDTFTDYNWNTGPNGVVSEWFAFDANGNPTNSCVNIRFSFWFRHCYRNYCSQGTIRTDVGPTAAVCVSVNISPIAPIITPPTLNPSCSATGTSGNTLVLNDGGVWGVCNNQKNVLTLDIYSDAGMTKLVKSVQGGGNVSGFSPNTRYYTKFTKSNGCRTATASCNAVTVTPNGLSQLTTITWDKATVRLGISYGGGVYNPSTVIQLKKCSGGNWQNVKTTTTKTVETIELTGLDADTCYQVRAVTSTTAGSYTGNTVQFTTPSKALCMAYYTSIEPAIDEETLETTAKLCYRWETNKVPATITPYYRVKNGYDPAWIKGDELTVNDLTGTHCFTITDLFPNQTVYETYIHTETVDLGWDGDISEFITPLLPMPDIHNCENFEYLRDLICQAAKALYGGHLDVYANPYTKSLCDPFNPTPTHLALWSRILRFLHAASCLVCDTSNANLADSREGQYLVGEAGWVDFLEAVVENGEDIWKLVYSDGVRKYIDDKMHAVWHFHASVDYLVNALADLSDSKYSNAKRVIVASENKIYEKVDGKWVLADDEIQPDDFAVYHINYASDTAFGNVPAQSAYYYWQGTWNNLDSDISRLAKIVKDLDNNKDRLVMNETGADRMHINTVDRDSFNCANYPSGERWVTFITESKTGAPPNYHRITFETGDNATIIQDQDVLDGALAQKPTDPKRTGYVFVTWNDKATGAGFNWSTPIKKDYALVAVWTPQPVTITFDISPATGTTPADIHTTYGLTITLPDGSGFSLTGATFVGWLRDGVPFTSSTPVVGDTELTPNWQYITYTVTFKYQNGQADTTQTIDYGQGVTQPADPVWADHIFLGWFDAAAGGNEFDFDSAVTSDKTIYAQWAQSTYTVTFDSDGGSAVPSQQVAYGDAATRPADPTKPNAVFTYWQLNNLQYEFSEPVTSDITLLATWETAWEVEFDLNGGTGDIVTQTVVNGDYAQEPDPPTRTDGTFAGWYNGDTAFDFDNTPITTNITLKARWNFTITFDANGGAPTPPNQTVMDGGLITKPTDPTKTGYDFLGWVEQS